MAVVLVAVLVVVLHLAAVAALWKRLDVDCTRLAASRENAVRGIVVPFAAGSVVLVAATTGLGWWGPVLSEATRLGRRCRAGGADDDRLAVARGAHGAARARRRCLLVGFAEELATRGPTALPAPWFVATG